MLSVDSGLKVSSVQVSPGIRHRVYSTQLMMMLMSMLTLLMMMMMIVMMIVMMVMMTMQD